MSKELFGEASKCRNKKQNARRKKKIEQEKLAGKSLDFVEMKNKKCKNLKIFSSDIIKISKFIVKLN